MVIGPGQPQGALSTMIAGLRSPNDVAMAQGAGVISYHVDNVETDKVAFFSLASTVTVREAPAGIGNKLRGVWTNGKIALVYSAGANSAVYGIKLQAP